MNGRGTAARGLRVVQWASFGLGAILVLYYAGARFQASASAAEDVARFEEARLSLETTGTVSGGAPAPQAGHLPPVSEPDLSLWDEGRIAKYEESLELDFDLPLGVLRIPSIGLEVPVLAGTDKVTLDRAVGHVGSTPRPGEPGNVGIAGHRDGFFRGLKDVEVGDRIELQTLSSLDFYEISEISIVQPDAVHVLEPTPSPALTLVTCYPFYYAGSAPQRYIVRAMLAGDSPSRDGNRSVAMDTASTSTVYLPALDTKAGGEKEEE